MLIYVELTIAQLPVNKSGGANHSNPHQILMVLGCYSMLDPVEGEMEVKCVNVVVGLDSYLRCMCRFANYKIVPCHFASKSLKTRYTFKSMFRKLQEGYRQQQQQQHWIQHFGTW